MHSQAKQSLLPEAYRVFLSKTVTVPLALNDW